jgi:hypothetical protein
MKNKENISPEEKLLKLIRGQRKQPAQPARKIETPAPAAAPAAIPHKAKIPLTPHSRRALGRLLHYLEPRKAIAFGLFISGLYLFASLLYPFFGWRKIKMEPPKTAAHLPQKQISFQQEPYEKYREAVAGRDIFKAAATGDSSRPLSAASVDFMKDLTLIGIVSGDNPQAIIEDKKASKTFYLSKNEFIGEAQVEDILEGKVILQFRGQRYELHL